MERKYITQLNIRPMISYIKGKKFSGYYENMEKNYTLNDTFLWEPQ